MPCYPCASTNTCVYADEQCIGVEGTRRRRGSKALRGDKDSEHGNQHAAIGNLAAVYENGVHICTLHFVDSRRYMGAWGSQSATICEMVTGRTRGEKLQAQTKQAPRRGGSVWTAKKCRCLVRADEHAATQKSAARTDFSAEILTRGDHYTRRNMGGSGR